MLARAAIVIVVAASCAGRAEPPRTSEPTPAPIAPAPSSPAPAVRAPAVRVPTVQVLACARIVHDLVFFHRARIELDEDGSFELTHANMTPEEGWSTFIQGRWAREGADLVLTPVAARRLRWRGDAHRHDHGETDAYHEIEERMTTTPWRLARADDAQLGEAYRVDEVSTRVFPIAAGAEPPPCDDVPPSER
jgi:hypothetical protein